MHGHTLGGEFHTLDCLECSSATVIDGAGPVQGSPHATCIINTGAPGLVGEADEVRVRKAAV